MLPLDDRRAERFNPDLAGRPQLVQGNRQLLFGGMKRLTENSIVVTKNKSYAVTAEIVVPEDGAKGVIVAQGGAFGGWSLYAKDGKPAYCYNLFGLQRFKVYGEEPLSPGEHQVRLEFAYDGGGLGKGGTATLYVDGNKVGEGRVDATVPMLFSADETLDLGSDSATPVTRRPRRRRARVQRAGALGRDRPRRRRGGRRPPDHAGRAPEDRDGPAVSTPRTTARPWAEVP